MTTAQSSRSNSSSAWGVVNMMMISPASQAGTTASSAMPEGSDPSKQQGGLRLAVVGENADELGRRMAERYGLVATSMNELMKGRKGRKTDNVRAKAVSEWLAERGGASTGERERRVSNNSPGYTGRLRSGLRSAECFCGAASQIFSVSLVRWCGTFGGVRERMHVLFFHVVLIIFRIMHGIRSQIEREKKKKNDCFGN